MNGISFTPISPDESLYISSSGFKRLTETWSPKDPQKNFNWTCDYTLELPIRMKKKGPGLSQFIVNIKKVY